MRLSGSVALGNLHYFWEAGTLSGVVENRGRGKLIAGSREVSLLVEAWKFWGI